MDLENLQFHELANIFPPLDDEQTKEMAQDIKAQGLHEQIVLFEEKILEGRNRYQAMKLCSCTSFGPDDFRQFTRRTRRRRVKRKSTTVRLSSSTKITNPPNRTCGACLRWTTSAQVRNRSTLWHSSTR